MLFIWWTISLAGKKLPGASFLQESPCPRGVACERRLDFQFKLIKSKKHILSDMLFLWWTIRDTAARWASYLLDHQNATHFGAGLRSFLLKTIINRFLNAKTLSGFFVPDVSG